MTKLVTSSSLACWRRCPRQYYYRYELGISKRHEADYFRFGRAFHRGLELIGMGMDAADAIWQATAQYRDPCPFGTDRQYEWEIEGEAVSALLVAHVRKFDPQPMTDVITERMFALPIAGLRGIRRAGKIDAIGRLTDGRFAIREYKTTSEDIGDDSPYWLRLRSDAQVSEYFSACRDMGIPVSCVLYDVTRKPTIRPYRATPKDKRKHKADGTLYANQRERDETPREFGERLAADIEARPDFYFAMREVCRTDDDLAAHAADRKAQILAIRDARKRNGWYRNVSPDTCQYCEFKDTCLYNITLNRDSLPDGFVALDNPHRELEG